MSYQSTFLWTSQKNTRNVFETPRDKRKLLPKKASK